MFEGKWEVYIVLLLFVYSVLVLYIFGSSPALVIQVNSIVIIGLLVAILFKLYKKES